MVGELQDQQQLLRRNEQLTAEIQRRVKQLAAINTVAASVSQMLDLDRALQTALEAVLNVIEVEAAAISLVEDAAGLLVLRAQRGLTLDFVSEPMMVPLGEGLSGQVVREDRIIVSGDLRQERQLAVPSFIREEIQAQALIPMHARGRVTGILSVMSHQPYQFSEDELEMLSAIADQIGTALENARLFEQTRLHEQRLSAVIHSAADPIIATDANGRVSVMNEAARVFMDRYVADNALGQPLMDAPFQPEFRDALAVAMRDLSEFGRFDVTLQDGCTYAAVVTRLRTRPAASDVRDGDQGWVIVARDISRDRQAERSRLEFMQNMAHDLRNPLGVTLSSLMMLRDFVESADPDVDEIFDIATEAVNRMHLLIDDLLNLEIVENGGDFEMRELQLEPLLTHAVRDMSPSFQSSGHQVTLEIQPGLPTIRGSYAWLYRAVVNYLSNAAKYSDEGGRIVLRARASDNEVTIEVEDDGPGIPLEAQGRLFERFYRLPTHKEGVRGSGLGLAMVKSVAEAHGGRVYVQSEPGAGSTFGFVLPLR